MCLATLVHGGRTAVKGCLAALKDPKKLLNPVWLTRKLIFVAINIVRHLLGFLWRDASSKSVQRWKSEALDPDFFARLDSRFKSYSQGEGGEGKGASRWGGAWVRGV